MLRRFPSVATWVPNFVDGTEEPAPRQTVRVSLQRSARPGGEAVATNSIETNPDTMHAVNDPVSARNSIDINPDALSTADLRNNADAEAVGNATTQQTAEQKPWVIRMRDLKDDMDGLEVSRPGSVGETAPRGGVGEESLADNASSWFFRSTKRTAVVGSDEVGRDAATENPNPTLAPAENEEPPKKCNSFFNLDFSGWHTTDKRYAHKKRSNSSRTSASTEASSPSRSSEASSSSSSSASGGESSSGGDGNEGKAEVPNGAGGQQPTSSFLSWAPSSWFSKKEPSAGKRIEKPSSATKPGEKPASPERVVLISETLEPGAAEREEEGPSENHCTTATDECEACARASAPPENDGVDDCMICFEAMETSQAAMRCRTRPKCHYFHASCLQSWIRQARSEGRAPTCPVCRCNVEFNSKNLNKYLHDEKASRGLSAEERTFFEAIRDNLEDSVEEAWSYVTWENVLHTTSLLAWFGYGLGFGITGRYVWYAPMPSETPGQIAVVAGLLVGTIARVVKKIP